jgi:hypothetical protein
MTTLWRCVVLLNERFNNCGCGSSREDGVLVHRNMSGCVHCDYILCFNIVYELVFKCCMLQYLWWNQRVLYVQIIAPAKYHLCCELALNRYTCYIDSLQTAKIDLKVKQKLLIWLCHVYCDIVYAPPLFPPLSPLLPPIVSEAQHQRQRYCRLLRRMKLTCTARVESLNTCDGGGKTYRSCQKRESLYCMT